jgi:hypothetical protein
VHLDVLADQFPDDAFDDVPRDWDWAHVGGYRHPRRSLNIRRLAGSLRQPTCII